MVVCSICGKFVVVQVKPARKHFFPFEVCWMARMEGGVIGSWSSFVQEIELTCLRSLPSRPPRESPLSALINDKYIHQKGNN